MRGPNTQAAIDERLSPRHCCICDRKMPSDSHYRYTCGSKECTREWIRLLSLDRTSKDPVYGLPPGRYTIQVLDADSNTVVKSYTRVRTRSETAAV